MFLGKGDFVMTAWHMAVYEGQIEVLQKLWEWAKEVLTQEDLNDMLYLAKDKYGKTAWHMAL